jgi:hypothetical protein
MAAKKQTNSILGSVFVEQKRHSPLSPQLQLGLQGLKALRDGTGGHVASRRLFRGM